MRGHILVDTVRELKQENEKRLKEDIQEKILIETRIESELVTRDQSE
jgi:hypothetical protein